MTRDLTRQCGGERCEHDAKMRMIFDISLCPTSMEIDGRLLDEVAVLGAIRDVAEQMYPGCTFSTLQVGHRQGDEWYRCVIDGRHSDETNELARRLVTEHVDWTDDELYEDAEQDD